MQGKDIVAPTGNQSANREYKHEPTQSEKPVYSTTVAVIHMTALIIQEMEGVTLISLAEDMGRELSSLSQAAGRLRKHMNESKPLQDKAEKIAAVIKTLK